jgi:formylglycine-generating enzyme required for sulfatase activity
VAFLFWLGHRAGHRPHLARWRALQTARLIRPIEKGRLGTLPVRSFSQRGFGLSDILGNLWEWAEHQDDPEKTSCLPQGPRGGILEQSFDPAQPDSRISLMASKVGSLLC